MRMKYNLWPTVAVALACLLGVYIGTNVEKDKHDKSIIVKTYKVPASRAGEARGALKRLFYSTKFASAQALGDGLLLVRIPKSYESGVDEMIKEFQKNPSHGNQRIKMDYWLLRGSSHDIKEPSNLSNLGDIIGVINEKDGKQNFQVLEHLSTDLSLGRSSKIKGWLAEIDSYITPSEIPDNYSMGLTFDSKFGKIETNTMIHDGQFVILAQNAANKSKLSQVVKKDPLAPPAKIEGDNKIYFIMKATKVL